MGSIIHMHFGLVEPEGFDCEAMCSDPNIIIILNLILTESRKSCGLLGDLDSLLIDRVCVTSLDDDFANKNKKNRLLPLFLDLSRAHFAIAGSVLLCPTA